MIYKNGFKEYSLPGIIFGACMGVFFGISKLNILIGIIGGIFCGILYSLLIYAFCKIMEKKFSKKRTEISLLRKVICDGGATYQGIGGWMFLTESGLEFYPHKLNHSSIQLTIPLDKIKAVKANKMNIVVEAFENGTFTIAVSHSNEWMRQINSLKGSPL